MKSCKKLGEKLGALFLHNQKQEAEGLRRPKKDPVNLVDTLF